VRRPLGRHMTDDELKRTWAAAERAAVEAELKVAKVGQAAQDPRVAEMFRQAGELRAEADRLLREVVAADLKDREPPLP
jgi:hypothetical protein